MSGALVILNMPDADDPSVACDSTPRALGQRRPASLYPCVGCHGKCCRLRVHVLAVEAFRIALSLGVAVDDVVLHRPYAEATTHQLTSTPILIGGKAISLELRRVPVTRRCAFAVDVNGMVRCGIYALRPALCRLYPYDMELDGERLRVGGQDLCPVSWLKDDAAAVRLAAAVKARRADFRAELRLLAAWNAADGARDWPAFVAFAAPRLMRHLGVDPRAYLPRRQRVQRTLGPRWW